MINTETVIKFYQHYTRELLLHSGYIFKPSQKEIGVIEKFLNVLSEYYGLESIGEDFLDKYFQFQFLYWKDLKTRFNDYKPIGWFIGQKAFNRWKDSDKSKASFIVRKHLTQPLKIKSIKPVLTQNNGEIIFQILKQEEINKQRYFNQDKGLGYCVMTTTLYHPKSSLCLKCKNIADCKELQRNLYPNFHRLRSEIEL